MEKNIEELTKSLEQANNGENINEELNQAQIWITQLKEDNNKIINENETLKKTVEKLMELKVK